MKLTREMSISHADFLRLVPRMLSDFDYRIENATIIGLRGDCRVTFRLGVERDRSIASLNFPVTDIEIELEGFSHEDAQAFIKRFETTYRRGGG